MPNWCHSTLRVEGPVADVQAFVDRAKNDEQPLTFQAHAPLPTQQEMEDWQEGNATKCDLCGGVGIRALTAEEAALTGASWQESWFTPGSHMAEFRDRELGKPLDDRAKCNACWGKGKRSVTEGWRHFAISRWGTKWDASFGGPFMALVTTDAPDTMVPGVANGVADLGAFVVYTFDTAWAPPLPWLAAASGEHPSLMFTLSYGEPGSGYAGVAVAKDGDVEDEDKPIEEVLTEAQMWF